jgi:hypothetical protein
MRGRRDSSVVVWIDEPLPFGDLRDLEFAKSEIDADHARQ